MSFEHNGSNIWALQHNIMVKKSIIGRSLHTYIKWQCILLWCMVRITLCTHRLVTHTPVYKYTSDMLYWFTICQVSTYSLLSFNHIQHIDLTIIVIHRAVFCFQFLTCTYIYMLKLDDNLIILDMYVIVYVHIILYVIFYTCLSVYKQF